MLLDIKRYYVWENSQQTVICVWKIYNHFFTFCDNHLVFLHRFTILLCIPKYMSQIGLFTDSKWLAWAFSQHGNGIQTVAFQKGKIPVCERLSSFACVTLANVCWPILESVGKVLYKGMNSQRCNWFVGNQQGYNLSTTRF